MTGEISFAVELAAKRIELLKDAWPRLTRAAVLLDLNGTDAALLVAGDGGDGAVKDLKLHTFAVSRPVEFEAAFAARANQSLGAVAIPDYPLFVSNPVLVAELATKHKLPSIGPTDVTLAGGLMAYGVDFPAMWYRAAAFVEKIFNGTKAGDTPIEQATRFEMIVNMKTAKLSA